MSQATFADPAEDTVASVTGAFADFAVAARYEDLPERAVRFVTDAMTDFVGCALVGSRQPLAPKLLEAMASGPAGAGEFLFGTARTAAPADAALYNATLGHALDYDDSSHPSYSHPTSHLLPTVFALARQASASGRNLLLAYVLGFELEGKLGRALNTSHYLKGWHSTSTFGAVASAAAASRLLRLNAAQTCTALGIAASAASGLRANFGTMTKPLHAGFAARAGVQAALLARAGFTAATDVLENRYGYLPVMAGPAGFDLTPFANLGRPWEIDTPYGICLKPYPACGSTHPAIEAALEIRAALEGEPIEHVRVGTNELCPQTLVYHNPTTPLEAKFSMEFCVAAALARGEVTMGTFVSEALADPAIRGLMDRMLVEVDERVRFNSEHGAVVTVRTAAGRQHERLVELARGKPERWPSSAEIWAKFADCADGVLPQKQARRAFDALQALPSAPSIDGVLAALWVDAR